MNKMVKELCTRSDYQPPNPQNLNEALNIVNNQNSQISPSNFIIPLFKTLKNSSFISLLRTAWTILFLQQHIEIPESFNLLQHSFNTVRDLQTKTSSDDIGQLGAVLLRYVSYKTELYIKRPELAQASDSLLHSCSNMALIELANDLIPLAVNFVKMMSPLNQCLQRLNVNLWVPEFLTICNAELETLKKLLQPPTEKVISEAGEYSLYLLNDMLQMLMRYNEVVGELNMLVEVMGTYGTVTFFAVPQATLLHFKEGISMKEKGDSHSDLMSFETPKVTVPQVQATPNMFNTIMYPSVYTNMTYPYQYYGVPPNNQPRNPYQ